MLPLIQPTHGSLGTQVVVDRPRFHDRIDLYITVYPSAEQLQRGADAKNLIVPTAITMTAVPENTDQIQPVVSLSRIQAQRLADELYAAGLRPTEAAGSAGAMAAVQEHLKDMRRLTFEPRIEVVHDRTEAPCRHCSDLASHK